MSAGCASCWALVADVAGPTARRHRCILQWCFLLCRDGSLNALIALLSGPLERLAAECMLPSTLHPHIHLQGLVENMNKIVKAKLLALAIEPFEEPKLKSPAKVEGQFPGKNKAERQKAMADLVEAKSSGTNLVPSEDPRPAVVVGAANEFGAVDAE